MSNKARAVIMSAKDNVATAVENLAAATQVVVVTDDMRLTVLLGDDIPFGHKFATRAIPKGEVVVKYGESIGIASRNIAVGEHVHVQNVESCRGRGDKQPPGAARPDNDQLGV